MISPEASVYHWSDPPDEELGYHTLMEFRLVYEGPLKTASKNNSRVADKHRLRKVFHKQLADLWTKHPALSTFHKIQRKKRKKPKKVDVSAVKNPEIRAFLEVMNESSRNAKMMQDVLCIADVDALTWRHSRNSLFDPTGSDLYPLFIKD